MFGKIVYISDNVIHVGITEAVKQDLMNMNIVFEDANRKILGEVIDISKDIIKVHLLGEIENGRFIGGVLAKPTMNANIRMINDKELKLIIGEESSKNFRLGYSPLYENKPIYIDINDICRSVSYRGFNFKLRYPIRYKPNIK